MGEISFADRSCCRSPPLHANGAETSIAEMARGTLTPRNEVSALRILTGGSLAPLDIPVTRGSGGGRPGRRVRRDLGERRDPGERAEAVFPPALPWGMLEEAFCGISRFQKQVETLGSQWCSSIRVRIVNRSRCSWA